MLVTTPVGVHRRNADATSAAITLSHISLSSPHRRVACAGVSRWPERIINYKVKQYGIDSRRFRS